jgi:hypothetical protein
MLQSISAEIDVSFDGSECQVVGPTEVPIGNYLVNFNDFSERSYYIYVDHLLYGKTHQDLVEMQSAPGVWWPKPVWVIHTTLRYFASENDNWIFSLNIPGEYSIYIGSENPKTLCFCAPLRVIE